MSELETKSKNLVKSGKAKLSDIQNPGMAKAIDKLGSVEFTARTSYWVSKSLKKLQTHLKDIDETRQKALKKYASLDDNGRFIPDGAGMILFKDKASEEAFIAEMEAFGETEVDVLLVSSDAIIEEASNGKLVIPPSVFASFDSFMY